MEATQLGTVNYLMERVRARVCVRACVYHIYIYICRYYCRCTLSIYIRLSTSNGKRKRKLFRMPSSCRSVIRLTLTFFRATRRRSRTQTAR